MHCHIAACDTDSEVVFVMPSQEKPLSIRQIEASHIGHLVKFTGIGVI